MTWNYRVMIGADESYSIREVFYDEAGDIYGWGPEQAPFAENVEGLKWTLDKFNEALGKPVLNEVALQRRVEQLQEDKND